MRSHTQKISAMSFDSTHRYLATVSFDESIRVWDLDTLAQLFDFQAPGELPCAIAYHPQQQCFACGFMSGCVRVFHVGTTNLLAEHNQHAGQVTGLVFTPNGEFMHSAGSLGNIASTFHHPYPASMQYKLREICFFVLSQAWDKEKILSPHEESNLRPLDSVSWYSTTEPWWLYGEQGPLQSSHCWSCILFGSAMSIASCLVNRFRKLKTYHLS